MHPLVVHFPIALLLIAPVFIALAMVWRSRASGLVFSAFVLTLIGAAFAVLSTATGNAAEKFAEAVPAAGVVLERHEELAELARNLSIGSAIVVGIAAVVAVRWQAFARPAPRVFTCGVLLIVSAVPAVVLANAAHEGGRLVHEFGVRAPLAGATVAASVPAAVQQPRDHDAD